MLKKNFIFFNISLFIGIYWKNLYIDYKESALGATKDCKEHPIRTSIYFSRKFIYVYVLCIIKKNLILIN